MSLKVVDKKNRWRNKTVAFRVSPEEWEQFETAARLSGLSKQEYLISRMYQRDIVVQGNPRVYKALRNELTKVLEKLEGVREVDSELLETIKLITLTLNGLKEETHVRA
ncbi:hypothetical protein RFF05_09705 [Bengtsoniella intestinalis]|uniref:plasmid mobilization protein n=1 Tax=Bengtsoniella intestinalis TaxID=3073143 RepID=UPI00391F5CC8